MSDQGLREALQQELKNLPVVSYDDGYRVQALPKATLLDLLAAHPAEPAPRPVIDREAVREIVRKTVNTALFNAGHPAAHTGWSPSEETNQATDAVMELARPMPTREEIAEALHVWNHESGSWSTPVCTPENPCTSPRQIAEAQADVVYALLKDGEQ